MIDEATATEVWQILRREAGASESDAERDSFVFYAMGREEIREYRFWGKLGFGGKVRFRDGKWSVYYYPEDRTLARDKIQANTNAALAGLSD